jgi:GNAT superfamily N-acetyltransferase
VAEVAVTVIDEYQGRGLGRLLFRLVSSVALDRGINRLCAYTLADNLPVRRELARVGASVEWDSGGLIRAEMDVRAALKGE